MFKRFREAFPSIRETIDFNNINALTTTFDWNFYEGTAVAVAAREAKETMCAALKEGAFYRGDYHHGAFLALLFLGVRLREGHTYRFVDLAKVSNARFLQRALYFVTIALLIEVPAVRSLYSEEERRSAQRLAMFSAVYYIPYFLETVSYDKAPLNDLRLIWRVRQLKMYEEKMATEVLKVMDRHTDYLGPRHIPAALVDSRVPREEREELARAIADATEDWGGEELALHGPAVLPGPNFASGQAHWQGLQGRPSLATFASPESFLLFRTLTQQPGDLVWMRKPSDEWHLYPAFVQFSAYVKKKSVVNDPAER